MTEIITIVYGKYNPYVGDGKLIPLYGKYRNSDYYKELQSIEQYYLLENGKC